MLHAEGRRERVVLRVYMPGRATHTTERAEREFRTIELVRGAGIPAPRPLFLDAQPTYLDAPSMLLSYVPGRPLFVPQRLEPWAEQLAGAMASIHAVTPDVTDLGWLPRRGKEEIARELAGIEVDASDVDGTLIREVLDVLRDGTNRIEWPDVRLVHEDFWPGNTVWLRGRLIAVIDWSNARAGDWRQDVSQCCVDALWLVGPTAVEVIRDAYRQVSGRASKDQWYFDLLAGLSMLQAVDRSLLGYHDAGLTFVTEELARERIHAFLARAIAASKRAS